MSKLSILVFGESIKSDIVYAFQSIISSYEDLKDIDRIKVITNVTKNNLEENLTSLKNKYTYILIVKGDESISNVNCTLKFHKGCDSIYGDIEKTSNNSVDIIKNMINRQDYVCVNTLGYAKHKINEIRPNYHLQYGGIWVKTNETPNIFISETCISLVDVEKLEFFKVI